MFQDLNAYVDTLLHGMGTVVEWDIRDMNTNGDDDNKRITRFHRDKVSQFTLNSKQ